MTRFTPGAVHRLIGAHVLLAVAAGLTAPATAAALTCPGPALSSQAAVESYIRKSSEEWAASVPTTDASVVKRILAEDFVWVLDGRVIDKKIAVAEAEQSGGGFLTNTADYVHIRFFGSTVVAQGSETWTKTGGRRGKFIWTDTWVERDKCWQIVNSQDTVVPLPALASH